MLQLPVRISRRTALLEASSGDPAQSCNDLAALARIQQSLEDVEATIIGLSEANRCRSAVSGGPALPLPGARSARFRRPQAVASIKAPDRASGLQRLFLHATGIRRLHQSTDHRPESKDSSPCTQHLIVLS